MANLKSFFARLWKDESGQGTAEYVLLIAIVVGLVIMFKGKIVQLIKGKTEEIGAGFGEVGVDK